MNRIEFIGRLTKDGELRTTTSGTQSYSNTIAVQRRYKNSEGKYDSDFFNFNLWGASEGLIKYLTKGKAILLEGRLQNRTYEKDGKKVYVNDIIAEKITLLPTNEKQDLELPKNTKSKYEDGDVSLSDEDIDKVFSNAELPF